MTKHQKLVKEAIEAVHKLFKDTSVSPRQTAESLSKVEDEITDLLLVLPVVH